MRSFDPEGVAQVIAQSEDWTLIHLVIVLGIILMLAGLIAMPLSNAYSRWRERRADVDPEQWVEWLLYSHPALSKRIAMAETNSVAK